MAQELVIAAFVTGAAIPASIIYALIRNGRQDVVARFIPLVEYVGDDEAC